MSIAVFGSINMDLVARTPHLPGPGETITGKVFQTFPGGKGANQAVACSRLGAKTYMVGRVGGDEFGEKLKDELEKAGVDHENVVVDTMTSSGVALIAVEDSAENTIIVIPGANGQVDDQDLKRLEAVLTKSEVLLLQLEIPLEMVMAAAKLAKENNVKVILDPAPAQMLPEEIYPLLDIITPNETETELLVGFPLETKEDVAKAAKILIGRGASNVIIKMGDRGAFALMDDQEESFEPYQVKTVDTVAAGDAFNGALAVALSENLPVEKAIQWGMAGGALSVTKEGAQPAMPERKELKELLKN
ncbi:MAG: ribokinase [Gammaproteobacteria bacterium]|nr:ribokinase [Gammaproteobacteria bacterium]